MTNWTELKRLAEIASEGPWNFAQHDDCAFIEDSCGQFICSDADHIHDSEFIAAANPKTILALISENEQYQEIMRVFVEKATCADWSGEDNESVFHTAQMWCGKYHQAKQEYDQLRVEVEALRKDAERYRVLREFHWSTSEYAVVGNPKDQIKLGAYCPSGYLLDAAIDEEIARIQP